MAKSSPSLTLYELLVKVWWISIHPFTYECLMRPKRPYFTLFALALSHQIDQNLISSSLTTEPFLVKFGENPSISSPVIALPRKRECTDGRTHGQTHNLKTLSLLPYWWQRLKQHRLTTTAAFLLSLLWIASFKHKHSHHWSRNFQER